MFKLLSTYNNKVINLNDSLLNSRLTYCPMCYSENFICVYELQSDPKVFLCFCLQCKGEFANRMPTN